MKPQRVVMSNFMTVGEGEEEELPPLRHRSNTVATP